MAIIGNDAMGGEDLGARPDDRLVSPSAERNKGAIAEVLAKVLPHAGTVVEIGSGTGQHVVHFARVMPSLTWQPTERDADCLRSISAWLSVDAPPNVRPPLRLDVHADRWPVESADAIVCINLVHIAPWSATQALMRGAGCMRGGGVLYLYGPYRMQGVPTSSSNQAFDAHLRAVNPLWGVRDLGEMSKVAAAAGLTLLQTSKMPANNLSVVFRRSGSN
jgi:hypothetical protein